MSESENYMQLPDEQRRNEIFAELEAVRQRIRRRTPELTAEDAYRLAGFSEEVIGETIEYDENIARAKYKTVTKRSRLSPNNQHGYLTLSEVLHYKNRERP
jgi:hypothetical protein